MYDKLEYQLPLNIYLRQENIIGKRKGVTRKLNNNNEIPTTNAVG